MIRRALALTLATALVLMAIPTPTFAQAPDGQISGTAHNHAGQTLANTTVRVRSIANGQIVGTTTSNASGAFSFTGLPAGQYVVEVVNASGAVVGSSSTITLATGAMVASGVSITTAALVAGGSFFGSTLGILTLAGIGGGIAGITVAATRGTASPSR